MAIGFGAGSDMMGAYNSNRNKLRGSKGLKDISENQAYKKNGTTQAKYSSLSAEKLEAFKKKMEETKKRETRRTILIVAIVSTIVFGLIFYLLHK